MFKKLSKIHKLKVDFSSHCEDERREDAAIQAKSTGSPRTKASRLTKKVIPFNQNHLITSKAFTLSEVLITLVIIGVVAAITVPMLMNDTNDKQWNVAKQKAQATIGEAFRLATINGEISKDDTAETFVKNVLPKYLKIAKSCTTATDCGFSSKVKRPDGTEMDWPEKYSDTTLTKVTDMSNQPTIPGEKGTVTDYTGPDEPYYFQTLDGFSVKLFYNPNCAVNYKDRARLFDINNNYSQQSLDVACFNATYDMNGRKGPNQVGKDIGFVGSFYNGYEAKATAVLPYKTDKKLSELNDEGLVTNDDSWLAAANYCNTLHENDYVMPDVNELSLLYLNGMLINGEKSISKWYVSRVPFLGSSTDVWVVTFYGGDSGFRTSGTRISPGGTCHVYCVRNNALK